MNLVAPTTGGFSFWESTDGRHKLTVTGQITADATVQGTLRYTGAGSSGGECDTGVVPFVASSTGEELHVTAPGSTVSRAGITVTHLPGGTGPPEDCGGPGVWSETLKFKGIPPGSKIAIKFIRPQGTTFQTYTVSAAGTIHFAIVVGSSEPPGGYVANIYALNGKPFEGGGLASFGGNNCIAKSGG
jgi:hypothetical protein